MALRSARGRTTDKRSIRTEYNGRTFRSKLEADWARVFDALHVKYDYEKSGRYFGDVFYFPDFWLPHSRQFVEIKAIFDPSDCRKICALIKETERHDFAQHDVPIVACLPDGEFYGWIKGRGEMPVGTNEAWFDFLTQNAVPVDLFRCAVCRGWWFATPEGSWRCRCCGKYEGAKFVANQLGSPLPRRLDEVGVEGFDIDLLRAIGEGDPITALV